MSETGELNGINWTASHVLLDNGKSEELLLPIKATDRIKYTCVGLSKRFIGFGATSGGLYVFQKDTHKYLQVLVNKEGSVTHVAFAPDDNLVGLSTSTGFVVIWQLNVGNRKKPEQLMKSFAHKGSCITCLQWNDTSQRLYSGDSKGKVTVTNAFSRKVSGLLQLPTAPIVSLDSAIVQLDFVKDYLLVSSNSKCHICNIKRQQFYSVGKKLRDGLYGACFYLKSQDVVIYSARPGSRLWEANLKGEVVTTHQFKRHLAIPDLPIINIQDDERFLSVQHSQPPQALNFPCLLKLEQFILSWNEKAIYILDTNTGNVVLWSRPLSGIQDLAVYNSDIYYIDNQNQICKLSFLSIERCIVRLFIKKSWKLCASICHEFLDNLTSIKSKRLVSPNILKDIKEHLSKLEKTEDLVISLDDVIYKMDQVITEESSSGLSSRRSSVESVESVRLESGIYLIKNRRSSDEMLEALLSSEVNINNEISIKNVLEEKDVEVDSSVSDPNESITVNNKSQCYPKDYNPDVNEGKPFVNGEVEDVGTSVSFNNSHSTAQDGIIKEKTSDSDFREVKSAAEGNEFDLQTNHSGSDVNVSEEKGNEQLAEYTGRILNVERTEHEGSRLNVERAEYNGSELHVEMIDSKEGLTSTNNEEVGIVEIPTNDNQHVCVASETPELAKNHNTIIKPEDTPESINIKTIEHQQNAGTSVVDDDKSHELVIPTNPVVILTPSPDGNPGISDPELEYEHNSDAFAEGAFEPVIRRTESFTCSSDNNENRTIVRRSYSMSNGVMDTTTSSKQSKKQRQRNGKKKIKSRVAIIGEVKPKEDKNKQNIDEDHTTKENMQKPRPKFLNMPDKSPSPTRSASPLFDKILAFESSIITRRGSPSPVDEVISEKRGLGQRQISIPFAAVKDSLSSTYSKTKEFVKAKLDHKKSQNTVENESMTSGQLTPVSTSSKEEGDLSDILVKAFESSDIYTSFEEATISTRLKLKHPLILYDINMCREVLEQWLTDLQTSYETNSHENPEMKNAEEESVENDVQENEKFVQDGEMADSRLIEDSKQLEIKLNEGNCVSDSPLKTDSCRLSFALRDDLHEDASELLMMCFEMQVFPNSRQPSIDQSNNNSLSNQMLSFNSEKVETLVSCVENDLVQKQSLESDIETITLKSECSSDVVCSDELDKQAAKFVDQFFHFLDINRIRVVMESWSGCRQRTYNEICSHLIDCFEGRKESSCKNSSSSDRIMKIYKEYKEVYRILRIIIDSSDVVIESLNESKHGLRIWEIKELFEIYSPETSKTLFGDYITAVMQQENPNSFYMTELCDDSHVFDYLVDSIFSCNSRTTEMAICTCSSPRTGSHKFVWKYQELLDKLLVCVATPRLAEICKRYGYWQGCLELSKHLSRDTILHIMWCLGDINILKREGLTPSSFYEWQYILNQISRLEAFNDGKTSSAASISCHQCFKLEPHKDTTNYKRELAYINHSDWSNTITWENTVQILAKSLGPQTAIDLLGEFKIPKNRISPEFFHNCIMGIIIDRNQRFLTHAMLEKVDSYLWSKRQNALPEQLKQFIKDEHRCQLLGSGQPKEPQFKDKLYGRQHFLEEPLSHWGVHVNLSKNCLVCGLPVTVQVSASIPGLLVFPCGHIFHSECIPEKFCMVCFYAKK